MGKIKYMMSGGLAFSEEKDMEKLHHYSLKGWHVRDFAFMGYTLEKGENMDYIYSIDYRPLKADERDEYIDYFSSAGWSHIATAADVQLFRAQAGTKPIYTDRETTIEKYENSRGSIMPFSILFFFITTLFYIGAAISSGTLHSVLDGMADILTVISFPLLMTLIAVYYKKWKVEGRKGLNNLVKILVVLSIMAAITLILISESGGMKLLVAVFISGLTVPIVIWSIMKLYHHNN